MPNKTPSSHQNWQVGQRVARKDSAELGLVVEVDAEKVKVKWDGGKTSYYQANAPGNVKLAESEP